MKNILVVGLMLALFGCEKITPVDKNITYYYNLDSLITQQQSLLTKAKATVDKKARISGDSSETSFEPDSLEWADELNVFREATINMPVLKGLYKTETKEDDKSNLKIKEFSPIDNQELEVSYLRIYYLDNIENIRKLEAEYIEDNPIYHSERTFIMMFDDINNQPVLSGYYIKGDQKMILQDTMSFEIQGVVSHD
ncbi:MAG: hypothetical protein AAFN93_22680 [Bacteroidota bacterium]